MNSKLATAMLWGLCWSGISDSATHAADVERVDYFVARIETDVHRRQISSTADAYAIINGNAFVVESEFDKSVFDSDSFTRHLRSLVAGNAKRLKLVLRYQLATEIEKPIRAKIKTLLKELGTTAGFEFVDTSEINTSSPWTEITSRIDGPMEPNDSSEPFHSEESINYYPLRTMLSRVAISDANFVVELKQPFDGRQLGLPMELSESIKRAVDAVKLGDHKGTLLFKVQSTDAGQDKIWTLFDARRPNAIPADIEPGPMLDFLKQQAANYKPSPAMKLAMQLGFERISVQHTPLGGAPEKLIGKQVPDFELKSVDGKNVSWSSFRGDRPGLVTFWGVACGPCVQEAPHLSKLHDRYGDKFAILAVNGYNEPQKVVAKFVAQRQITHSIVLDGRQVAQKTFHVASYPTTFWVDQTGVVRDYHVGFDSAESLESQLHRTLESN